MALNLKTNSFDRLRMASLLDGVSFLILLCIAMPLKHLAGIWQPVRIMGSLHGAFFVTLCLYLLLALVRKRLSFRWCLTVLVCAFIPSAPFFLDRRLKAIRD